MYTVVSFGHVAQARTVLPQGRKDEDFVIEFNITIKDSLSAETAVTLRVIVSGRPFSHIYFLVTQIAEKVPYAASPITNMYVNILVLL